MPDENTENFDSTNEDLELDLEDDTNPVVDTDKILESNKRLYERAKKAEIELKAIKAKPIINGESQRQDTKPSDILKADEFKLYRQGYNESEIDLIMHNGGMKALVDEKSPLSLGLKVAREQRMAEDAANATNDKVGLSDIERKYTTEQMKNMSTKELEELIGFAQ